MGYMIIICTDQTMASAEALNNLFHNHGLQTRVVPHAVVAEQDWTIRNCACLMILFSGEDADWASAEVKGVIQYRKPILPVQIRQIAGHDTTEPGEDVLLRVARRLVDDPPAFANVNGGQHPAPDAAPKQIEVIVWSPVNTAVYLNDKQHLVMQIDHNTGFDYQYTDIMVQGMFKLIFVAKGFEKEVVFDAGQINRKLEYRLHKILSAQEIQDSYDRKEAVDRIRNNPTAYALDQLACVGTAEDIPLLQETLKKLSSLNAEDLHGTYLMACCAVALGKLALRFDCPQAADQVSAVYETCLAKSKYGYLVSSVLEELKQQKNAGQE